MPDLHLDAVNAFWDSYDRRTLYRVIIALERVEHWVLDSDPAVEAALIRLGEVIDAVDTFDLQGKEAELIRILTNTRASRALRILQALDIKKRETAAQVLMYAEEANKPGHEKGIEEHAKLFLRRNLVFERLQLLSRVFNPSRLSLILKAVEKQSEE